jgi:hypothetical protein
MLTECISRGLMIWAQGLSGLIGLLIDLPRPQEQVQVEGVHIVSKILNLVGLPPGNLNKLKAEMIRTSYNILYR